LIHTEISLSLTKWAGKTVCWNFGNEFLYCGRSTRISLYTAIFGHWRTLEDTGDVDEDVMVFMKEGINGRRSVG